MNRMGISAVIATVLIILIVVVGVGIIWKVILPLFAELDYLGYSDVRLNIVFQGYTIYDPDRHFAFVQIERGNDDVNITGLEIGFNFEGTTKTYQTMEVPDPGGKHTYKFNFTADGIGRVPSRVSVAPIFILNNQIKLGRILDEEDMPLGKIHLSAEEWDKANKEAVKNVVKIILPGGGGCNPNCNSANCGGDNGCGGKCIIQDCGLAMECDNSGECVEDLDIEWQLLTGCAILDEPNKAYKFEENFVATSSDLIDGTCITIDAEGVVVDFYGNTLSYDYASGWSDEKGILITSNGLNSEIRNGKIEEFVEGIYLDQTEGNVLQSLEVRSPNLVWYVGARNVNGIILNSSSRNSLKDIIIEDTFFVGLFLQFSSDNVFQSLDLFRGGIGIGLINSPDNIMSGATIRETQSKGIHVEDSDRISFSNINVQGSGEEGIFITRSDNVFIYDLNVTESRIEGMLVRFGTNSHFERINSSFNGGDGDGIEIVNGVNNTFVDIFTGWNGDDGFELEGGNNNSVYNLYSVGNLGAKGDGIRLEFTSNNYLENIYLVANNRRGAYLEGAGLNTFVNITAIRNGENGIVIRRVQAKNNTFIGLTSFDNTATGLLLYEGADNNVFTDLNISNNGIYGASFSGVIGSVINGSSLSCGNPSSDYYCLSSGFVDSESIFDLEGNCVSSGLGWTSTCP